MRKHIFVLEKEIVLWECCSQKTSLVHRRRTKSSFGPLAEMESSCRTVKKKFDVGNSSSLMLCLLKRHQHFRHDVSSKMLFKKWTVADFGFFVNPRSRLFTPVDYSKRSQTNLSETCPGTYFQLPFFVWEGWRLSPSRRHRINTKETRRGEGNRVWMSRNLPGLVCPARLQRQKSFVLLLSPKQKEFSWSEKRLRVSLLCAGNMTGNIITSKPQMELSSYGSKLHTQLLWRACKDCRLPFCCCHY